MKPLLSLVAVVIVALHCLPISLYVFPILEYMCYSELVLKYFS